MTKNTVMAVVLMVLMWSLTAQNLNAGFLDGNALYKEFKNDTSYGDGFIRGYTMGVIDALLIRVPLIPNAIAFCVPSEVSGNQVRDITVKYLKDHPEKRHLAADVLIHTAMIEAFPC